MEPCIIASHLTDKCSCDLFCECHCSCKLNSFFFNAKVERILWILQLRGKSGSNLWAAYYISSYQEFSLLYVHKVFFFIGHNWSCGWILNSQKLLNWFMITSFFGAIMAQKLSVSFSLIDPIVTFEVVHWKVKELKIVPLNVYFNTNLAFWSFLDIYWKGW